MKSLLSPHKLKLLAPGCGILGLLLRLLMAATGIDDKGLLIPHHPAWIGLWVFTIAVALALLAGTRPILGPAAYRVSFPPSVFGAAGCALAAISALTAAFRHFQTGPVLSGGSNILSTAVFYLCGALILLAAVSFLLVALCRLTEQKALFLLHVAICIYFALQMLELYQTWSFDPHLHEYCFQLFACIALTITAYQLAAFDMGKGSHRALWFWGLASVYLCCVCLNSGLFFLTGGLWALGNLSNLRRKRKRIKPEVPSNTDL